MILVPLVTYKRFMLWQVLDMCSQILGALSPQRLATITAKFLKELCEAMAPGKVSRLKSDLPTPRQEILHLCRGMRHVKLSLRTSTEVNTFFKPAAIHKNFSKRQNLC